jgi:alpha-mannosidase
MNKILTIFIVLSGLTGYAQEPDETTKKLFDFVTQVKDYQEGFAVSTGSNDFRYHSFRSDIMDCLLSRATDGKMSIEWETAVPHDLANGEAAGFIWIAAMDIRPEHYRFDFYFNGIKRFAINTSDNPDWSMSHEDGAVLKFHAMETDHNGDAHGYMALKVPASWLIPGKPQEIRITGEPAGSNAWIIVYKATDAADFLQNSVVYDKWLTLTMNKQGNRYEAAVEVPVLFAGETLSWSAGGQHGTFVTQADGKLARGHFKFPVKTMGSSLIISDPVGEIVALGSLGETGSTAKLLSKAILSMDQKTDGSENLIIEAKRIYNPKAIQSLHTLSDSDISNGTIYLMNSSHQDIAWMDSPEKCVLERDTMLLTPLFEMASVNPQYRFDVEDALMLKEYIERHPGKKELVRQMLADGRISCGSTFIQPYEEMYSGEALARQFYFGAKWLKDEFGYVSSIYWNLDVPGRTLQMPQIMKKAGTEYLMMSRFEKGFYRWYSPDGSSVIAFSPGHYADAFTALQKNFNEAAQYIASASLDWEKYYPENDPGAVIPLLSDWDMSPAVDYTPLITQWEKISEIQDEKGKFVPVRLPGFKVASGDEFFREVSAGVKDLPAIRGERPAIWLYIHGPSHQQAIKASREGDILLTQAEKFATVNAWVNGSYRNYPEAALRKAWEAKIYPDHGWGGKNGDITDQYFFQKFLFAKAEGERILEKSLSEISGKIKTDPGKGTPLVVFNSLSWVRTDVVNARVFFDPGESKGLILRDAFGQEIPVQIREKETYGDGSVKMADIWFIARDVPSIGYKTFYYSSGMPEPIPAAEYAQHIENDFYKVEFGRGGVESIYDKVLERDLIDASKFRAGEIFTMQSVGNGAGEFADVQQPDMEGFDKTGNYETSWEMIHHGPVFTSFKMRQPVRNAVVEEEVIVYHDIKRIDFNVDLLNWEGILYREYRFALPLNMPDGQVAYEVPYGVLEVGKDEMEGNAGERYIYPCKETRPRGIQNWIGAYDDEVSIILSSSVVVADYYDPTDNPLPGPVLQPVLLASRKSCHWEGNDYLQTGNHSFFFSLTSTRPDWRQGYKSGIQANEELVSVVAPDQYLHAFLPEENSFFNIDQQNVMITALKKAEDESCAVVRMVEMEGEDSQFSIGSFKKIENVEKVSLIEETVQKVKMSGKNTLSIGHHAIETYKLK